MPGSPRRWVSRLFTLPDLDALDGAQFAALVLLLLTAGCWLAVRGIESYAGLRHRGVEMELSRRASSPVPYRHALAGPVGEALPLVALVRTDSVPPEEDGRLCALLRERGGRVPVRAFALTGEVPPCAREAAPASLRSAPADRPVLRGARWLLVEGGSVVLYSRRDLPSRNEVERVGALFLPREPRR
ncbi:MAG TPA: hypothetical protein VF263_01565 [Longimicrobiaceae bacterium]